MKKTIAKILILLAAIVLCIIGILQGDADSVMRKAVMICMECIGIG